MMRGGPRYVKVGQQSGAEGCDADCEKLRARPQNRAGATKEQKKKREQRPRSCVVLGARPPPQKKPQSKRRTGAVLDATSRAGKLTRWRADYLTGRLQRRV